MHIIKPFASKIFIKHKFYKPVFDGHGETNVK